jgi:AGCS family alanine or glycine:cation symporter
MLEAILDAAVYFNDRILWGPWTMIFIAGAAIYFTVVSRFFQFRKGLFIFKNTFGKILEKPSASQQGRMSPFQAVATALGGTVGTGNLAGVATALVIGGPGAIFWMWLMALLGMMLKTAEITLAVHYREVDEKGHLHGGPMYYIRKGLGWNKLVYVFCIGVFSSAFLGAAIIQPHTVGRAFVEIGFNIGGAKVDPHIVAGVMSLITGIVVIGGVKRIGRFLSALVPLMSLTYLVGGVVVFITNADQAPDVFALIFRCAFSASSGEATPVIGGAAGVAVIKGIQQGMSKGMYSNEAGQGTAPMAHATADTAHPFQQGIWGSFEVFVDTLVICTITAFAILSTGVLASGETGIELLIRAFSSVFSEDIANVIIFFCILTFCLSTQIGFFVYYETATINLLGKKSMGVFKWLYLVPGVIFAGIGSGEMVNKLWSFASITAALCAIPNLIAVLALRDVFKKLMDDYMTGANRYATEIVDKSKETIRQATNF